ncbi:MAG: hypothetical protein F6K29_33220 [Okeania sp. SIO2G5]|nr:hypothetical protein [Okeania sp. SIO2G5]
MNSNRHIASTVCPMCGRGCLTHMVLMETLSCDLCQHMFAWNRRQQRLDVLDVSSSTAWHWDGGRWQQGAYSTQPMTTVTLVFAMIVVILPALMIEVASYVFPPLPDSPLEYFHLVWAAIALILHGGWVLWILAESYHFAPYTLAKVKLRAILSQFRHQQV